MSSTNHFQLIVGALEVGLEGAMHPNLSYEMPSIFGDLHPPVSVRAVVTIDNEDYEVTVQPVASRECSKSTHGRHTTVDGKCIGCGEQVS